MSAVLTNLSNRAADRLREIASALLLLPLVAAIAVALIRLPTPERVRIVGDFDIADRARIEALLSSHGAAAVVHSDIRALRTLLEDEPWIDRAVVRRLWPDQLEVGVSLVRPLGQTPEGREVMRSGELGDSLPRDASLPLFAAPESRLPRLLEVHEALRAPLLEAGLTIASIEAVSGGVWIVGTEHGPELVLSDTDFTGQVRRVLKGYRALLDRGRKASRIDGRYPDGIAILFGSRPDTDGQLLVSGGPTALEQH